MWVEALKVISLMLLASIKMLVSVPAVLLSGYAPFVNFLILFSGGSLGVLVFYFFGGSLVQLIAHRFKSKDKKRIFSWSSRLTVKVKRSWGIIGIAFITPMMISIPIGSIIAYNYFRDDRKTLPALFISVAFWSALATIFGKFFI